MYQDVQQRLQNEFLTYTCISRYLHAMMLKSKIRVASDSYCSFNVFKWQNNDVISELIFGSVSGMT